jgi:membrane protease YdiL (CAAX protease family)
LINQIKYLSITLATCFLLIPIFFGFYKELLFGRGVNLLFVISTVFLVLALLCFAKIVEIYGYDEETVNLMQFHEVIYGLITKRNKAILWIFFPLTMVMEELIFRYYLIGFIVFQLRSEEIYAIIVSSIIFALYHVHFLLKFRNARIVIIFVGFSFLLGLLNGFILLNIGLFPCILVHYLIALLTYYSFYRRYFKNKK